MRRFVVIVFGLVGIGAGITALAGYPIVLIGIAGWLFPAVLLAFVLLPPIAIQRMYRWRIFRDENVPQPKIKGLRN